jgi:hypothetical protein
MKNITHLAKRPAEKQDAQTPPEKTTALAVARVGAVSAAVFGDGTVSLRRSYRTPAGEWKQAHSLRRSQLADAIEALTQCQKFLAEQDSAKK